jgi:acyl homoserine lactone synthase
MIRIIPGAWRDRHPRLMDEMHKLRRSVFYERLRWQVTVINRWEIDGYDALDPLYVLSVDEDEKVIGGLRLLPTTGFNMLNDTFSELLPDGEPIHSPLIWELSRFTVRMTGVRQIDAPIISRATAELGLALNEIGKAAALTHMVAVYDRAMHRMLLRHGCAGEPLGPPQLIGGVESYAVIYEVGAQWDERVRALSGVDDVSLDLEAISRLRTRLAS